MKSRRHGTLARVGVKRGRSLSAAAWACYISAALLALCSFAFAARPFGLAAMTVLPVWFWWLIGGGFSGRRLALARPRSAYPACALDGIPSGVCRRSPAASAGASCHPPARRIRSASCL